MVELRTRNREMRGDGTNNHQKLEHNRISCASQFLIPDLVGTSSNLLCNNTETRSSKPIQASCTPAFSYPLVSSITFSTSPPSRSLSSTIQPSSQNTTLGHLLLSLLAMMMSGHRVQHTPSTASTQDCLSSLHSHYYELTPQRSFSFRCASLHHRPLSASSA